ncbi:hypothetical protein ACQW02_22895 [Humitalea sp. 24SJ18S-53]|uniref:hypothetical protein n=1 Tax=Humitalea sp. 24SJ18S-53 TaxID=3422307 RepID=UPI003D67D610
MLRRALIPLLLLAGCTATPGVDMGGVDMGGGGGIGDPLIAAATSAPSTFGNMGQYQGNPAGAARAIVQLEFLTNAYQTDPIWAPQANPIMVEQLQQAQAEMRQTLGIAQAAPAQNVVDALNAAAQQISAGNIQGAQLALSAPGFTLGGAETLRRLGNMQSTTLTSVAAAAVNQAAMMPNQGMGNRPFGGGMRRR